MLYISQLGTPAHIVYYSNSAMAYLVAVTDTETGKTKKYKRIVDNMFGCIDEDCEHLYSIDIFDKVYGYVKGKGFWQINIGDLDIYEFLDFDMKISNWGTKNTSSNIVGVADDSYTLFSSQMHITNNLFTLGALLRSDRCDLYEIKGNKLVVKTDDVSCDLQYTILDVVKFNRLFTKIKVLRR